MNNSLELVFVPTPGMGHLLSAVELSKTIIQRNKRISILILIIDIPMNSSVNAYVDSQSQINPYPTRLTFVTLPLSNFPDPTNPNFLKDLIELHKPLAKIVIQDRVRAGFPSPIGFIVDMFCTAMIDIATDLNVPSYIFFTSGASFLNLMFHFQSLTDNEGVDIPTKFKDPNIEFKVPGFVNQVTGKVVPQVFLDHGSSMILEIARKFRKSKGILINTFTELEKYGVEALLDQVSKGSIPPVYPVGPILDVTNKSQSGSLNEDQESILRWLDDQPSSSVVFLCFGSLGSMDSDQVKEVANGLENSGYRFLWSLRKPAPEGEIGLPSEHETFVEALPEGFMDRVGERGKLIGWAPQVSILAHPAIGGFVSHCGWNSVLESLWFGVPIATWPLYAEQQLNAFALVKEFELGVEIRMDYKCDWMIRKSNFIVTAEEIENGVRKLMSLDEGMRKKVRGMSDEGRKALEDGGSSHVWFDCFIQDVLSNSSIV